MTGPAPLIDQAAQNREQAGRTMHFVDHNQLALMLGKI
jgi:hypothetical protein